MTPAALLPEFDHEMAGTRRMLERVPDEHLDWRPHEKSFTLRALSTHVANLPKWIGLALTTDSVDYLTLPKDEQGTSAADIVARFDARVLEAREHINTTTPEGWGRQWAFRKGEEKAFEMPCIAAYRTFVMNHIYHHRGQLSVYLRLLNVPVPGLYGPSADEK